MKTKTKHFLGYAGTAVLALGIGGAAAGGGSSDNAAPRVSPATVLSTTTVTATAPAAAPAAAETTTVQAPAVTKTVHAPAVTKTVTSKPKPKPKASFPGDGSYRVGADIKPGTYVSSAPDSGNCYWARRKGTSGSFEDIIANNNSAGQSVVTIAPTDKVFETNGCNEWTRR